MKYMRRINGRIERLREWWDFEFDLYYRLIDWYYRTIK
jgi:hypothetical protein